MFHDALFLNVLISISAFSDHQKDVLLNSVFPKHLDVGPHKLSNSKRKVSNSFKGHPSHKTFDTGTLGSMIPNLGSVSRHQISKYGYLPALTTQVKIFDFASMTCLSGEESHML